MAVNIISKIKPVNNQKFPIADASDIAGGYSTCENFSDLDALHIDKKVEGALVYVKEGKAVYQYDGTDWVLFSTGGGQNGIYILDTEPIDKNGLWIDTTESSTFTSSNGLVLDLVNVINILQKKVESLEYLVKKQMDFGDFTNVVDFEGDGINPDGDEEDDRTSEEEDNELLATLVSDEEVEPAESPLAGHLCIKSGTYKEMVANKDKFNAKELLFCYDINALFIKSPKTFELVQIGTGSTDLPDITDPDIPPVDNDTMAGIISDLTRVKTITWADMADDSKSYIMQIKDGKLDVYDKDLDINKLSASNLTVLADGYCSTLYFPVPSDKVGSTTSPKIYINSIYCGDSNGVYDYCPVSHNFIELSNTGKADVNLKGLFLHYTERYPQAGNRKWVTLPLRGVLKSNSTFLIRGAQCSVEKANTTKIHVGTPDMYWTKDVTYNSEVLEVQGDSEAGVEAHSIWDDNGFIKLAYNCSLYITGGDVVEDAAGNDVDYYAENVMEGEPFNNYTVYKYYVDLFGVGKYNDKNMPAESAPFATNNKNVILCRYYDMDMVSQATKALSARKNSTEWQYINLDSKLINVLDYTPKASADNKNVFFNKTLLKEGAPNTLTCTFGHNAHTTRCFTWVSVGYYDEYLEIKEGENGEVKRYESFKEGDNREAKNNRNDAIYDRIRSITTDGTPFTVHKLILDFDKTTETVYKYRAGREDNWTEWKQFTLRPRDVNKDFNFLQFSDQQGFNGEEYETMRICNELIQKEESFEFMINVGDMTQNGNRINEWLDYFKAADCIMNTREHMFSIGNNDLCPVNVYELGYGADIDKSNPINANYFFTFEHPYEVPKSAAGVYLPCNYTFIYNNTLFLSTNSEFTNDARILIYGDGDGDNVYVTLKGWIENEVKKTKDVYTDLKWNLAFCHEAPFTIITADLILGYMTEGGSTARAGSHLNTVGDYFYSKLLEDLDFKLCMCGHKHTYSNSRYIHDNPDNRMKPFIYDPKGAEAEWYTKRNKWTKEDTYPICEVTNDKTKKYVRYVMTLACGYKLVSNKELPAQNIHWLMEYYPVTTQTVNQATNTATVSVNSAQQFPNYIVWNVGEGHETETSDSVRRSSRARLLGKSKKIQLTDKTTKWAYTYNVPLTVDNLKAVGGNGSTNPNNNIIVEYELENIQ